MDNIPRGILLTLVSTLFFVALDTLAKLLIEASPVLQVAWGRYIFSILLLPLLIPPRRLCQAFRSRRPLLQLSRSALLISMTVGFFTAIKYIPLVDAVVIGFAAPFLTTALAIPVLGERVGARRWTAITIGFVGVLIALRPDFDERHWAYFIPVGVAAAMAGYNVLTRLANRYDTAQTSIAYSNITGAIILSVLVVVIPGSWGPLSAFDWASLAMLGACATAGHFTLILAFRNAPVSVLAPFTFAHIVMALLAGLIVFQEIPDAMTIVGAAIIVASGVYVFHREAKVRNQTQNE